jgi:hypothetical protein
MEQRTVQIWVQDQKVDLFNDEKISMSLSTQNFKDIKKVFTDFTQSFTLPATPNNNKIFSYWYENALDAGWNANYRVDANVEINHTPFREGKLQLEEAVVKEGQIEFYKVTFYGKLKSLFDLFGEDKLVDLDYGDINFTLSGGEVEDRIDGTTVDDVAFPLISSEGVWTYGDAGAKDISVGGANKRINFDELFPALYLEKIWSLIESKYSVTFVGSFRLTGRWTAAYVWWKNRELSTTFTTEPHLLTFGDPVGSYFEEPDIQNTMSPSENDKFVLNGSSPIFGNYGAEYFDYSSLDTSAVPTGTWDTWREPGRTKFRFYVSWVKSDGSTSYLDLYINGTLISTTTISGTQNVAGNPTYLSANINQAIIDTSVSAGLGYTVEIYSRDQVATTYSNVSIIQRQDVEYKATNGATYNYYQEANYDVDGWTSGGLFDWNGTAPDIKISDFVTGIFKMFNLTCYATNAANTFLMEPLGDFYAGGDEIDITEYVDEDTVTYKRPKLHQEISFEYAKSKSFLNENYKDANSVAYGDLKESFPFDGPKYDIKVPFEHLLFQEFTGTDIKVAYSLTKPPDYKPYVPKPVILYRQADQDITGGEFYFYDGSAETQKTTYVPFGNEYLEGNTTYSLNFGSEISVENLVPLQNSLYYMYYRPYLENLFNYKQRIVQVKAMLPQKILNYMTLDDALIIRDKKYRINQAKLDLTGGPVDLELFNDFVSNPENYGSTNGSGGIGDADPELEPFDPSGGTITIPIRPIKPWKPGGGKPGNVDISAVNEASPFLTSADFGTTVPTDDIYGKVLTITVAANTTGAYRCNTFDITYKRPDGTTVRTVYYQVCQESDSGHILTEGSDTLITERGAAISEE